MRIPGQVALAALAALLAATGCTGGSSRGSSSNTNTPPQVVPMPMSPTTPDSQSSGLPRPSQAADSCTYFVHWADGVVKGDVNVIQINVAGDRLTATFTPAAGYELTYFDAKPPFRLTGGSRISTTTIRVYEPLSDLRVCGIVRPTQPGTSTPA